MKPRIIFSVLVGLSSLSSLCHADITVTGDVNPSDAAFWAAGGNNTQGGTIGSTEQGSLTVNGGSILNLADGVLGETNTAEGSAWITGNGSTWQVLQSIAVGRDGMGTLHVDNMGQVIVGEDFLVGQFQGGTGQVQLSGSGTQLQTEFMTLGVFGSGSMRVSDGATLTTNERAILGDFEFSHGAMELEGSGTSWTARNGIFIGSLGTGQVTVWNGANVVVEDSETEVGSFADVASKLTVRDTGTKWTSDQDVTVNENSMLEVLDGGVIETRQSTILADHSTTTVRGSGAALNGAQQMFIGNENLATLNVSQGGRIRMGQDISLGTNSVLNMVVDGDGMMVAGTDSLGAIVNDGTINLIAGGAQEAGSTSPFTPGVGEEFENNGVVNGIGGIWNDADDTFTISAMTTDGSGDLSAKRVSYFAEDLVVSFNFNTGTQSFNVTELDPGSIGGETVLGAYNFVTAITELTALSFFIEGDIDLDELSIWYQADGATLWELFVPEIIDYTDGYLTFTTNTFSSYAVTQVPEPTTAALGLGALALAALRRRMTK